MSFTFYATLETKTFYMFVFFPHLTDSPMQLFSMKFRYDVNRLSNVKVIWMRGLERAEGFPVMMFITVCCI